MKKLIVLLVFTAFSCATIPSGSKAQKIVFSAEQLKKEKIVPVSGKTKNQLYVTANKWMVDTFNNASSVIEFTDKEAGTIIGKYLVSGNVTSFGMAGVLDTRIYAKINIEVKDNKAKIEIIPTTNISATQQGKTIIENNISFLVSDFEKFITTKKDDW